MREALAEMRLLLAEVAVELEQHRRHVERVVVAVEEEQAELELRARELRRLREAWDAALIRLGLLAELEAPEEPLSGVRLQAAQEALS